jgi:hypothetical protein
MLHICLVIQKQPIVHNEVKGKHIYFTYVQESKNALTHIPRASYRAECLTVKNAMGILASGYYYLFKIYISKVKLSRYRHRGAKGDRSTAPTHSWPTFLLIYTLIKLKL